MHPLMTPHATPLQAAGSPHPASRLAALPPAPWPALSPRCPAALLRASLISKASIESPGTSNNRPSLAAIITIQMCHCRRHWHSMHGTQYHHHALCSEAIEAMRPKQCRYMEHTYHAIIITRLHARISVARKTGMPGRPG